MDAELAGRIDGLPRIGFAGEAFRHIAVGRDPLSGIGARVHGGRWNPPESFITLYLGLTRETVVGELRRLARRQFLSVADLLPRRLYRFEVTLARVLDLRERAACEQAGLSPEQLRSHDLVPCQRVGEAAHHVGFEAIMAPSAVDGVALAVFTDRLAGDSAVVPIDFEEWVAETGS